MASAGAPTQYERLVMDALASRDATIPPDYRIPLSHSLPQNVSNLAADSKVLNGTELAIIDLTATQLRDAIAAKHYTAVQVIKAYVKAAAIAQQGTNCLVELFAEEAYERAAWLDAEYERTGKVAGPLHGVPVSVKDHIDVKGHDSPSGFLALVGKMMATEDAHMVSIMRSAGAVFYTKTTNPQSIMHLETTSYLGVTVNPYNTSLSAGGSSGGEGALMGMKGSCLGIGTDIGGSIRSPAAACGIYGFKPSVGRLPYGGCNSPMSPDGDEGILCTHGPFGRSVDDLELYMKVVADSKPWLRDPTPWRDLQGTDRKLRIGILHDDGVVKPVTPIRRALDFAVAQLRKSERFEVVDYTPILGREAWDIIGKLYWPDRGKITYDMIAKSGEPVLPLTKWIIDQAKDNDGTVEGWLKLVARRDKFRTEVAAHWQASNIDVLLSPVGPTPAPAHETAKYWNYTSFWNLANYPAAVFPTGLSVDPAKDANDKYEARNSDEEWVKGTFDARVSVGAPLCLQLIGYIGHDEETLAALRHVVEALK